jgi:hypothetical protein
MVSLYRRYAFLAAAKIGDVETIINYVQLNKIQSDIDALQQARILAIINGHVNIENIINDVLNNSLDAELLNATYQPLEYAICNEMENEALALVHLSDNCDVRFTATNSTAYELASQRRLGNVQLSLINKGVNVSSLQLTEAIKTRNFPIILALLASDPAYKLKSTKSLQQYSNISKIGNGNYGVVTKSEILETREQFALKRINDQETFTNEVLILSRYHSHHIVNYLWSFYDEQQYLVAYELLDGLTLGAFYNSNLMEMLICDEKINIVSEILNQLRDGLQYLEESGVIHFDLHVDNIFLHNAGDQSFIVKIIDFGKAREIGKIPATPLLGGAINYSPPEAFKYKDISDFSTKYDVFSYGIIAFLMSTSAYPFPICLNGLQNPYPDEHTEILCKVHFSSSEKTHVWPMSMASEKYLAFREHVDAALTKLPEHRPLASRLQRLQLR